MAGTTLQLQPIQLPTLLFHSEHLHGSALLTLPVLFIGLLNFAYHKFKRLPDNHPPIVHLTEEEVFDKPRQSYESALRRHGSVVAIKRKGILEYIVSREHTRQVLTDDSLFSFEKGVTFTLNINFMQRLSNGAFFRQVDALVQEGVTSRLDAVVGQVYPVFHRNALQAMNESTQNGSVDMFEIAHRTVSQAMILAILGEAYLEPEMQNLFIATASGFAAMSGVTNNHSILARRYPTLERLIERSKYVVTVGMPFAFKLAPAIYKDLARLDREGLIPLRTTDEDKNLDPNTVTLLTVLAKQQADEHGHLTWYTKIYMILITVILIFASVHQTASVMVWVVFELAVRPEYIQALREETNALIEPPSDTSDAPTITHAALRRARHMDSFIREVMRTKGDTLNHIRVATADAALGGYVIPKGSPVLPLTSLSHSCTEYHGNDANVFDGYRYVDMDRPAAMTGPGYLSFGLSRWACPGRFLAIAEIKMLLMSILSMSTPELIGGKYRVVDKLNITSVPPEGELVLKPLL